MDKGDFIAIVGPNGSGKSTLAKIISGLLKPKSGSYLFDGNEVTRDNIDSLRNKIGIVFQDPESQFIASSVEEDLAFGLEIRNYSREEMIKDVELTLKSINMEEYKKSQPYLLSGGQKQRVAIGTQTIIEQEILIFDEPTSMLDTKNTKSIVELIKKLSDKKTIILITHDPSLVDLADRVIVMEKGSILDESTPRELFDNDKMLKHSNLSKPSYIKAIDALSSMGLNVSGITSEDELIKEVVK